MLRCERSEPRSMVQLGTDPSRLARGMAQSPTTSISSIRAVAPSTFSITQSM